MRWITYVFSGALVLTAGMWACGEQPGAGSGAAQITARVGPVTPSGNVACLAGTDEDGDGVTDYFTTVRARFMSTTSVTQCLSLGGTPFETWAPGASHALMAATAAAAAPAPATQNYSAGGDLPPGLARDVEASRSRRPYEEGLYDCDDFANDLEVALEDLGYEGTYTEICVPTDSKATWHAITDIHFDGQTYWVDGITGKQVNLDADGDGQVTPSTTGSACAGATEGTFGIRVWPDLAARLQELGAVD